MPKPQHADVLRAGAREGWLGFTTLRVAGPPGTQRLGSPVRAAIWLIIVGFATPE